MLFIFSFPTPGTKKGTTNAGSFSQTLSTFWPCDSSQEASCTAQQTGGPMPSRCLKYSRAAPCLTIRARATALDQATARLQSLNREGWHLATKWPTLSLAGDSPVHPAKLPAKQNKKAKANSVIGKAVETV